jgi:hypothetical protein
MRVSARTTKDWTRAHKAKSVENKNRIRVRERLRMRINRKKLTQQQRQESLEQDRERKRRKRSLSRKRSHQSDGERSSSQTTDSSDVLLDDESIRKASNDALEQLHKTIMYGGTGQHLANVCVICDCFIIGTEVVKSITDYQLQQHKERFSVRKYKEYHHMSPDVEGELDPYYSLWKYYEVPQHEGMLLSPRAKKMGPNTWSCCQGCFSSIKPSKIGSKPPRMAIANGFAIGEINIEGIDIHEDVNDVTRAILSPVRSHGYIMAFSGGAHKSIQGHYQFFELDQQRVHGAMHHLRSIQHCQHIYVMFAGRMTPSQRQRVRRECTVNTEIYNKLAVWFTTKSCHPGFDGVNVPEECPQPIIIESTDTDNNNDNSADASVENIFTGGSYFFSTGQDPEPQSSIYGTNKEFTLAMLKDEKPTLLVYGGNYKKCTELLVEDLLPFAFPYGKGGPKQDRPTNVSIESCIQRYARLANKEFLRGDTILVLHHIFGRQLSFKSGVITCRSNVGGTSMGERFANLTERELRTALQNDASQQNEDSQQLIRGISTSCRALGHTPEAAQHARRNGFAYQDFFGLNSVFVTISPCDECSFRVRLFVNPGVAVSSP